MRGPDSKTMSLDPTRDTQHPPPVLYHPRSTLEPPHFLLWYTPPVQTHPTLAEKNRRGERTKTEREREKDRWRIDA